MALWRFLARGQRSVFSGSPHPASALACCTAKPLRTGLGCGVLRAERASGAELRLRLPHRTEMQCDLLVLVASQDRYRVLSKTNAIKLLV